MNRTLIHANDKLQRVHEGMKFLELSLGSLSGTAFDGTCSIASKGTRVRTRLHTQKMGELKCAIYFSRCIF